MVPAKALGDTGGSTCSELVTRKELFARGDLNITSDVGQSFTIDFSMRMEAEGGAVADLSSFLVPEELSNGIAYVLNKRWVKVLTTHLFVERSLLHLLMKAK